MLRKARSLLPRLPAVAAQLDGAQAALPAVYARQFTSTSAASGVHIEEEVYNRCAPAPARPIASVIIARTKPLRPPLRRPPTAPPPWSAHRQRQLIILGNRVPTLAPDSWVAPSAVLVGDVDLYEGASVWYGCVLRGDLNTIKVGAFSNVQDRTVIHAARSSPTGLPAATAIGRSCTVGQACLLRSVHLADECVVGDKSVLLEGSMMEKGSVLAPGSVLPPGRRVPAGQLWAGAPARFVRDLTKDEKAAIPALAAAVAPAADAHAAEFLPSSFAYVEAEALLKILKPDAALVAGADLAAVAEAAAVVDDFEDAQPGK